MSRPTPTELQTGMPLEPREAEVQPSGVQPTGVQPARSQPPQAPKRGWVWLLVLAVVAVAAGANFISFALP